MHRAKHKVSLLEEAKFDMIMEYRNESFNCLIDMESEFHNSCGTKRKYAIDIRKSGGGIVYVRKQLLSCIF